jgi:hypothetical protein
MINVTLLIERLIQAGLEVRFSREETLGVRVMVVRYTEVDALVRDDFFRASPSFDQALERAFHEAEALGWVK